MSDIKIDVIDYLDIHAVVESERITPFGLENLKEIFPAVDEFTLQLWQK